MIDMVKLGGRFIAYRQSQGLTQEELGEKLGVSAQAVSKWERGLSLPDTAILPDIARIFKTSVDALLETECPGGVADKSTSVNAGPSPETGLAQGDYEPFMKRMRAFDEITLLVGNELFRLPQTREAVDVILTGVMVLRRHIFQATGLVLPIMRLMDVENPPLGDGAQILLRSTCVWQGSLNPADKVNYDVDRIWWEEQVAKGVVLQPAEKPVIDWSNADKTDEKSVTADETGQAVVIWAYHILRALYTAIMNEQPLFNTVDHTARIAKAWGVHNPVLTDAVMPGVVSLQELHAIFQILLADGYSIKNQLTILESLLAFKTANPDGDPRGAAAYAKERL